MSGRVPLCLALLFLSLPAPAARADDFDQFRIPEHRALRWNVGATTRARRISSNSSFTGTTENDRSDFGSASLELSSNGFWLRDSDPAFTFVSAQGRISGGRSSEHRQEEGGDATLHFDSDQRRHNRSLNEIWSLTARDRRYPWAFPFAFSIEAEGFGNYGQAWEDQRRIDILTQVPFVRRGLTESNSQTWAYQTGVRTAVGAGLGRVRDATVVYEVAVLEQRLRETGALTRELSSAARRKLAELLYVRNAYGSVRDRPGRTMWREVERILAEDGALREGGLEAYDVLRAAETPNAIAVSELTRDGLPFSPLFRLRGWFAGVRVRNTHVRSVLRYDTDLFYEQAIDDSVVGGFRNAFASRNTAAQDMVEAGVGAEYHRPMGLKWQWDSRADLFTGLREQDKVLSLIVSTDVSSQLADRWLATAFLTNYWFDENRREGPTAQDNSVWLYGVNLLYYLEDRLTLDARIFERQDRIRGDSSGPRPHRFDRDGEILLGLTYRPAGWFATPGLFADAN